MRLPKFNFINLKLLEAYKKVHGNLKVPEGFVVPLSLQWPKHMHGSNIGEYVTMLRLKNIRDKSYYKLSDKIAAEELGFKWDIGEASFSHLKLNSSPIVGVNVKMLEVYHQIHGNWDMNESYIVPDDDPRWPKYMWGANLGAYVRNLRISNAINPHYFSATDHSKLNKLGFSWKESEFHNFGTIFSACDSYKQVYGNLKISERFTVPYNDVRFPQNTWGMKLFSIVNYLKTTACLSTEQHSDLCCIGFDFSEPDKYDFNPSMDVGLLYRCMETYKARLGDLLIPYAFTIENGDVNYPPEAWGAKLGTIVHEMRSKYSSDLFDCAEKRRISSLGFVWYDFNTILSALVTFKELNNTLVVSNSFVIAYNDNDYPPNTWGLHLGKVASKIRKQQAFYQHKAELQALGFDLSTKVVKVVFSTVYSALQSYKSLHGNVQVPQMFIVPQGDENYPKKTWGIKLGKYTDRIRNQGLYSMEREKLEALGFQFASRRRAQNKPNGYYEFDTVFRAFQTYKKEFGNLHIPREFVIQANDERFDRESWGLRLGNTLKAIVYTTRFSSHRKVLTELGVYDAYKVNKTTSECASTSKVEISPSTPEKKSDFELKNDILQQALLDYKAIHGDIDVPKKYTVPRGDSNFNKSAWGLKLGALCCPSSFNTIYTALLSYKRIHNDLIVSRDFTVPYGDADYPEHTWGMKLGWRVFEIRSEKRFSEHRAHLEKIGFVFDAAV